MEGKSYVVARTCAVWLRKVKTMTCVCGQAQEADMLLSEASMPSSTRRIETGGPEYGSTFGLVQHLPPVMAVRFVAIREFS